jgi:hypothetical protein
MKREGGFPMRQFAIGLLVVLAAATAFAQQQTPDCQDVAFARGYRENEPSFEKRTQVSHARDVDAGSISRTPAPLSLVDARAKKYSGTLIPEFEGGGKRIPPDETQVWQITGKISSVGCDVQEYGFGDASLNICDRNGKNCTCVSLSPPECVGDSIFSAEILKVWEASLKEEFKVGSFVSVSGPGFWCCENGPSFFLKPVIAIIPAADPGDGGGEPPVPVNPPDVTIGLPENISGQPVVMGNGETNEFEIVTNPVASFNGDVVLTVWSDALESDNFSVTVDPSVIPAPGRGEAQVKISTSPMTFPRDYLVTISALANEKTFNTTFIVKVTCDPPGILGIHQPRDATVNPGVRATFEVSATGTGPFQYQWYRGRRGSTVFPIANTNTNRLEVTGVDDINQYWVRVSNACGTVDSSTVSIAPSRLRSVRR